MNHERGGDWPHGGGPPGGRTPGEKDVGQRGAGEGRAGAPVPGEGRAGEPGRSEGTAGGRVPPEGTAGGPGAGGAPPDSDRGARKPEGGKPGFARRHRRELVVVAAVLIAFLAGFAWQFVRAQRTEGELERTRTELEFSRMEATLGAAAVAAGRGHFETGRVLASRFFTELEDRTAHPRVQDPQQLRAVMAQRDAAITALSRGTPEADELMTQLLIRFRVGLHGPEHAIPLPGTDGPEPEP